MHNLQQGARWAVTPHSVSGSLHYLLYLEPGTILQCCNASAGPSGAETPSAWLPILEPRQSPILRALSVDNGFAVFQRLCASAGLQEPSICRSRVARPLRLASRHGLAVWPGPRSALAACLPLCRPIANPAYIRPRQPRQRLHTLLSHDCLQRLGWLETHHAVLELCNPSHPATCHDVPVQVTPLNNDLAVPT